MAMISTSKNDPFLSLVSFMTITFLVLLHKVNSSDTVTFSISKFDKDSAKDLILQGDASIDSATNVLQLTKLDNNGNPKGNSVGRVLHSTPVHLRDTSGRSAGFTTSFVFRITSPGSSSTTPADGLTFFIASPDSTIPPGSGGAFLGLFSGSNALNNSRGEVAGFRASASSSSDRVFAVEFDTYSNDVVGDPSYKHVGIDANSIRSRDTAKWEWVNGDPAAVTIIYEPYSKVVRVMASHFSGPRVELTHSIDLANELPEWVRVGFSASTGLYTQANSILSWSFHSVINYVGEEEEEEEGEGGYVASVM